MADFQLIETAPKDGTIIGGWSQKEPGVIRLTRWAHHLDNPRYAAGWSSITRSIHLSNVPTHWIAVGPLPGSGNG